MQIHVVQTGESLSSIAAAYEITTASLASVNGLTPNDRLVTGQALVVPIIGSFYYVQEGDTLFSIGNKFGIDYKQLAKVNNIPVNQTLNIGQKLYIPPQLKSSIEVNAYIEPFGQEVSPNLQEAAQNASPFLTYLAPFSFQIQRDGSLREIPLDNLPQIARDNAASIILVVTNLEEGQFSAELARDILSNEAIQDTLITNIINTARQINARDVHFDLEFIPPVFKEEYTDFLRKAKRRLQDAGLLMSVALAPKTSATQKGEWYEAHDYRAIGEIADFVVIMTYEWGYSAGPPLPVSPLPQVREVIEYALTEMPAQKILMGQNLYGYDWTLPFVEGGEYAKSLSPQQAIEIAKANRASIQYDETAQAPFIKYTDENNKEHIIWFEDARSIQAKFDLIKELDLRGISYWKLSFSFPQNWLLLQDNFNIIKK
ncbi:MAG: LysM peptidoglycan-binding domain-containing protein [Bacilli bacterium]|jgi:spore germination protein|nr:LysM peptidoglycan-binding domain-containing protein [Acholeplasmataceae bacterium]